MLLGSFALVSSCASADDDPPAANTDVATTAATTEPPMAEELDEPAVEDPADDATTDPEDHEVAQEEDPGTTGGTDLLAGLDLSVRELDCGEQLPGYVLDAIPGGADDPRLSCWAMDTPENAADPDGQIGRAHV